MRKIKLIITGLLLITLALSGTACKKKPAVATEVDLTKPVKAINIQLQNFTSTCKVIGTAFAIQDIMVSSQANGQITWLSFNQGDNVASGSMLIRIDHEMAKAQLDSASSNYQLALTNYQMQEPLYTKKFISDLQFKSLKNQLALACSAYEMAKIQYKNTNIAAPISGVIAEQLVKQGEFVTIGRPIFRIVDLSKIKVKCGVTEETLGFLRKSNKLGVLFSDVSPTPFTGSILSVGSVVDNSSKTFPVEIVVNNADRKIKPGMVCDIRLIKAQFSNVAVVPQDTIIDENNQYVFIVKNNIAKKIQVVVLGTENNMVAVSGLAGGESLITVGGKSLNDGDKVKVLE